jgi:hypothetical protein
MEQSDRQDVVDTVHAFCRVFDLREWSLLQRCLAAELATDYSSFRGTPPTRLKAAEYIAIRRSNLTGLITQHLALNHFVTFSGEHSQCRFDFIIHRWPQDTNDSRFFHTFGYYEIVLHRELSAPHGWVIESITQQVLRSEGNSELHGKNRDA